MTERSKKLPTSRQVKRALPVVIPGLIIALGPLIYGAQNISCMLSPANCDESTQRAAMIVFWTIIIGSVVTATGVFYQMKQWSHKLVAIFGASVLLIFAIGAVRFFIAVRSITF